MSETKLRFTTLAVRRSLASEHEEMAPIASPQVCAYGSEDKARGELELALSELPDETRPASVARLLLPDGVRIEHVDVELPRIERLGMVVREGRYGGSRVDHRVELAEEELPPLLQLQAGRIHRKPLAMDHPPAAGALGLQAAIVGRESCGNALCLGEGGRCQARAARCVQQLHVEPR